MRNKLYPLKFTPIYKCKIWGGENIKNISNHSNSLLNVGESWDVSAFEESQSVVANGPLRGSSLRDIIDLFGEKLLGKDIVEEYGNEFPLLVKIIDATDKLSIQVHPNDDIALKLHNMRGKNEMWYVLSANDNAYIIAGWNSPLSKDDYISKLNDNDIESIVRKHPVKAGDVFFIPAGTVHAIGNGCLILEIQQSSDITYRIFDYNRLGADGNPRELHTDLALMAFDFENWKIDKVKYSCNEINSIANLVNDKHFCVNIVEVNDVYVLQDTYGGFSILSCVEGNLVVKSNDNDDVPLNWGETVLIPAELTKCQILGKGKFLQVAL